MKKRIQFNGSTYRIVSMFWFTPWVYQWHSFNLNSIDNTYVPCTEYSYSAIWEFDTLEEATEALISLDKPRDEKWRTI